MITNWTPQRLAIWANMSPERRDYDRVMAHSYPPGQGKVETPQWREYLNERATQERDPDDHGCSCHVSAPCGHCESCPTCNCLECDDWHDTNDGEICPNKKEVTP